MQGSHLALKEFWPFYTWLCPVLAIILILDSRKHRLSFGDCFLFLPHFRCIERVKYFRPFLCLVSFFKKDVEDVHSSHSESLLEQMYQDDVCKHDEANSAVMNQRHWSLNPIEFLLTQVRNSLVPYICLTFSGIYFVEITFQKGTALCTVYLFQDERTDFRIRYRYTEIYLYRARIGTSVCLGLLYTFFLHFPNSLISWCNEP